MSERIFEKATRAHLRFDTAKGLITTEDLWDLPLTEGTTNLDDIAKGINRRLKQEEEESFVTEKTSLNRKLALSLEIVKEVIAYKLEQKIRTENAAARKARKEKILEILEEKEDSALRRKSQADLRKELEKESDEIDDF